jgi:hypothetical protein
MKRIAYQIQGQTNIGIEFEGNNGLYFWVPDRDCLHIWRSGQWQDIPITNLGAKRRNGLTDFWGHSRS